MTDERHSRLGARFAELHQSGCFLLANVGDAWTAKALGEAGVDAIATSSSAHAKQIGRDDAAGDVSMEEHAEHTAYLAAAADVPLNVDAENGYGHEPEDMAAAVQAFAATGAAGMGIEDWSGDAERGLYDRALAIARIEAAVEAALDVVLEGRTAVIIAHRLQTTMRADRIVVVDGGGIAEVGTREELVAAGGHFADMWATGGLS